MSVFYFHAPLTRAATESWWTACTRRHRTTPLCSAGLKKATKLPQTSGAAAVYLSCICPLQPPCAPFFRRALEDASIIEQSLRSELERARISAGACLVALSPLCPDLPSGDVARRAVSSAGGGAAVADSSRLAPAGEWSALQASSLGRRQAPLSSSTDSRLAPPPLPPFFDNTLNSR